LSFYFIKSKVITATLRKKWPFYQSSSTWFLYQ
jgi:hypothetical protein